MNEQICRLCLQTITDNNCKTMGESLVKTLKLNPKISNEPVMCVECASRLQAFPKFNPGCVCVGDRTLFLSDIENGPKLDPEQIKTTTYLKSPKETKIKCSFCSKTHGREDLISIRVSKENKFLLEQYILEMNLKNTEEILTCGTCLEVLERFLSVILKCREVEENISKYIELTDDKGQIQLKEVQKLMLRPKVKKEIESVGMGDLEGSCDQIKEEHTSMADLEIKYEKEIGHQKSIIKTDDDIKSEQSDWDMLDTKSEKSKCDGLQEPFIDNEIPNLSYIPVVTSEMRKCEKHIKQHLLTHKDTREPAKMFKYTNCLYETIQNKYLTQHLFTHESPSELNMFKCELCSYKAKRKYNLIQHLLTHKSPSELFKCGYCSYKAIRKNNLIQHLLTHKSPLELNMFKCELCSYEAKFKHHLKQHLLIHRSPSEIKMFKCELCPYEAKRKFSLRQHLLIHKSASELKMFKCELCSYEAKQKGQLKSHLLTHKSPSELKMFKCEKCPFEAKQKSGVKKHLLTHKSQSKLTWFKCGCCSYKAIRKYNLIQHLLTHKSPSELNMFKCTLCTYETKFKQHLKQHFNTHKSPSETKTLSCSSLVDP